MSEGKLNSETTEICHLLQDVRVTSPSSSSEDSRKIRNDSGCSFEVDSAASTGKGASGNSTDSGHGSSESEDATVYAYHFMVPSHLCGKIIGAGGETIKTLKSSTKCDISLVDTDFQKRGKSSKEDPKICILQGRRSHIERCLEVIEKRFPLDQYPEFSIKQINEPTPADLIESFEGLCVTIPPGQLTNVVITAIINTAHIFIQLPEGPTFIHLQRLEQCMNNVYHKTSVPKVPLEVIEIGLVCVIYVQDKYYRVQVVSFFDQNERCEVKFLDYGGYENVEIGQLLQIRQDFLNLPFQAVECYLSNVIPPASGDEWPFESIVQLEEITRGQNISCREIGVSEDSSMPIVQLYYTRMNNGELETRFINKELVDIGAAQWIEH